MPLPNRLVQPFRNARDRWRLGRLAATACSPGTLRSLDQQWLDTALAQEEVTGGWAQVDSELHNLGITASAGGINPGDRRALYHLVRALEPANVLEVGTHIGASTSHIAVALRDLGDRGQLTTVDLMDVNHAATQPWIGFGSRHSPASLVAQLGMADRVRFVAQSSLEYLRGGMDHFDLIFLDGDHSAATVYLELPQAFQRLSSGGVVLLHDYFPGGRPLWPDGKVILGPWLATERLRREGAGFRVLPLGTLPWPTKQGTSTTSLALVTR